MNDTPHADRRRSVVAYLISMFVLSFSPAKSTPFCRSRVGIFAFCDFSPDLVTADRVSRSLSGLELTSTWETLEISSIHIIKYVFVTFST